MTPPMTALDLLLHAASHYSTTGMGAGHWCHLRTMLISIADGVELSLIECLRPKVCDKRSLHLERLSHPAQLRCQRRSAPP